MSHQQPITAPLPGEDTTRATLTARDQGGVRVITLDCRHGAMAVTYTPGRAHDPGVPPATDTLAVGALVLGHSAQYGACACVMALADRFGVADRVITEPMTADKRRLLLDVLAGDPVAVARAQKRVTMGGGR